MHPSVMKHNFSRVPHAEIPRSSFDRSHGVKTTFNSGYLIPFFIDEAVPGDTFNLRTAGFCRLSTPLFPVMDNMFQDTFFFSVPKRLVWDNFQRYMGEQDNPTDSTDFLIPQIVSTAVTGYAENSIFDYMGIPTKVPGLSHSALPFRALNLIYNQWFRDQNLQNSLTVNKGDGPDLATDYDLFRRGKRHDYFTSSLPWPQKGAAIDIPLGSVAPVLGIGKLNGTFPTASQLVNESDGTTTTYANAAQINHTNNNTTFYVQEDPAAAGFPGIYVDLASASAATINQLRQAFQLQKLAERDARGGTRYTEIIKAHFGVTSPDSRLQRPEYLGGGSSPVYITPIASTSSLDGSPGGYGVGELGAMGTTHFTGHGFSHSFTEHCIVIGFVNVRADLSYQQGLNRMWSHTTKQEEYWPALAQIGEQAVLNKEIYAVGTATPGQDDAVFGYQERYAEYRYKPSTIHGQFRSNCTAPLDAWHLAQEFGSLPQLNDTFIQDNPPIDRIVIVNTEPQFIGDFYHKLICARPMPLYGVPGNIDRF